MLLDIDFWEIRGVLYISSELKKINYMKLFGEYKSQMCFYQNYTFSDFYSRVVLSEEELNFRGEPGKMVNTLV